MSEYKNKSMKHTLIGMSTDNEGLYYYVWLGRHQTDQFPQGLMLSMKCKTPAEAEDFAKLVDDYVEQAFIANNPEAKRYQGNPKPFWKEPSLRAIWNRANDGAKTMVYFAGFTLIVVWLSFNWIL